MLGKIVREINEAMVFTGSRSRYHWLTSSEIELGTLVERCPEILENKFVAITSFDSGPLVLNDEEIAKWVDHAKRHRLQPKSCIPKGFAV